MPGVTGRATSMDALVDPAVVRTAVERLVARKALAAREVHAALSTPYHVLHTGGRLLLAALNFSLVALENPVRDEEPEGEQKYLGQAKTRVRCWR